MRLTARGAACSPPPGGAARVGELLGYPLFRALAGVMVAAVAVALASRPTAGHAALGRDAGRAPRPRRASGKRPLAQLGSATGRTAAGAGFTARDPSAAQSRPVVVRSLAPGGSARYRYELPTTPARPACPSAR